MNVRRQLRSWLLNKLFSERAIMARRRWHEFKRKLQGRKHVVSVFLQLDDPYSYLLSRYLAELQSAFDIELRVYLTEALQGPLRPAPELYPEYALSDCKRVARELGIAFLDQGSTPPVEHRRHLLDVLAARESAVDFAADVYAALETYWRGDLEGVSRRVLGGVPSSASDQMLRRSQRLLKKLGHYNSSMLYYGGEWYWGVDRLHYLVGRLRSLRAERRPSPKIASISQVMRVDLPLSRPQMAASLPPLEVFYSFRSPYSYLSLARIVAIADAFGLELRLRPVLPMVMRGMAVPKSKLLYIMFDACREARRHDVLFGKIADPVGPGVERCLAVSVHASSEGLEWAFAVNAGEAAFGDGVDLATDAGLKRVCEHTGLSWPEAKHALGNDDWRELAERNRREMMAAGSWGVPTFKLGEFVTWGQDRDWLLAHHLEELCYDDSRVFSRPGERSLGP